MKKLTCLLAALLILAWGTPNVSAEETHEGKVVSVADGKLTMTDKDGKNEHSHMVPKDATITCDGKDCKLDDLTKGCWVTVTQEKKGTEMVVTKIVAKKSKEKR
jgi:hypothetical protein